MAARYDVPPILMRAYFAAERAYCRARIAVAGGATDIEVGDETVRFGLSTRMEYRRARDLGGERAVIAALLNELDGTETVWDVGAGVGTYTCFVANALTSGHVVAFEPEATNRARLRENLTANAPDERWTILPIALADRNGVAVLASEFVEAGGGHHYLSTDDTGVLVQTQCGAALVSKDEFGVPDVLKIDVQGAEKLVLDGMGSLLDTVESIYLEIHREKSDRYETHPDAVEESLRDAGYTLIPLGEPTNRRSGVYLLHACR
ncbi:FkbM family methyltransferase [Halococcus thailandensis]|uniref:FkbM family methyltransferase n=1 Tax=Halococcus thailandensis TaxID=335952 RepID=UPI000AD2B873|nr:FkbM family methyltransferase [Halococcus thailandensis]